MFKKRTVRFNSGHQYISAVVVEATPRTSDGACCVCPARRSTDHHVTVIRGESSVKSTAAVLCTQYDSRSFYPRKDKSARVRRSAVEGTKKLTLFHTRKQATFRHPTAVCAYSYHPRPPNSCTLHRLAHPRRYSSRTWINMI